MTLTDIANIALESLSERAISSIDDEGDDLAVRLKRNIFHSISEVERSHHWTCLCKTEKLVRQGTLPTGERLFIKPSDFAGIIESYPNTSWRLEGKNIVAPLDDLCILYTRKSFNPDDWDEYLRGAVISRFRADIALNVSGDSKIAQLAYQQAQIEIPRYIRNDIYGRRNRHLPRTHIFDGW